MIDTDNRPFVTVTQEVSGACGDLGTFIPHVLGAITVAGLAPVPVLSGFGAFLIATGLFYGLPLPVQPMKAVSAVILTGRLNPGEVAAAGLMIGATLFILGITGWIARLARLIPQSVAVGLQLGLGLLMARLGLTLILETPLIGFVALAALVALIRLPRVPAAPLVLAAAAAVGAFDHHGMTVGAVPIAEPPHLILRSWQEIRRSLEIAVLPQLSLTFTNAVIVTASLSRELFGAKGQIASERHLAVSSGLANLLLCPFGAMPMCHGAGGLQAQYRFGAPTGLAPILFGATLILLAIGFGSHAAALFELIPIGAVGALLVIAGGDLAISKRLFDGRPSCLWVIGATALAVLTLNPALALAVGWIVELIRAAAVRRMRRQIP